MNRPLTDKQKEILRYCIQSLNNKQKLPTLRDVAEEFGITHKGANDHVKAIIKKGYIRDQDGKHGVVVLMDEKNRELVLTYKIKGE